VIRTLHLFIALAALTLPASAQQIAFTWDDLPAHSTLPDLVLRVK
jgi:hypothetical protein